jgi:hypothetical protein
MASPQDSSIGVIQEVTYGVSPGAVTRWPEFLPDPDLNWVPKRYQGLGLRVGSRVARSGRRVTTSVQGSGGWEMEATSKGMGLFWLWALGALSSNLVSGSTYQQVGTLGDTPPSFCLQQGMVEAATGIVDATTYLGCMINQMDLTFANDDVVKAKYILDIQNISTAIAYAAPGYATAPNLFQFANAVITTGALTEPTTIALGVGATAVADVMAGTLSINNNLSSILPAGGGGLKSKPTVGLRAITGTLDIDYDSTLFRDAFLADTPMNLVLTWTGGALSTGLETLQVIVSEIKFDGDLPKSAGTNRALQAMKFTGLDNLTAAQPLWVVSRTADIAA